MSSYFVALVYAVLKDRGVKTDNLTVDEAIDKFNELNGKNQRKKVPQKTLSKNGWAAFYRKLGEMQYGADGDVTYFSDDSFSFEIEDKFLFVTGTYENPIVYGTIASYKVEAEYYSLKDLERTYEIQSR